MVFDSKKLIKLERNSVANCNLRNMNIKKSSAAQDVYMKNDIEDQIVGICECIVIRFAICITPII